MCLITIHESRTLVFNVMGPTFVVAVTLISIVSDDFVGSVMKKHDVYSGRKLFDNDVSAVGLGSILILDECITCGIAPGTVPAANVTFPVNGLNE